MARKTIHIIPDPRKDPENIQIALSILEAYGVAPGDTIRYRRTDTDDQWSKVRVSSANSDMSILCYEDTRARSFLPGYAVDLQVRRKGPRGGTLWNKVPVQNKAS